MRRALRKKNYPSQTRANQFKRRDAICKLCWEDFKDEPKIQFEDWMAEMRKVATLAHAGLTGTMREAMKEACAVLSPLLEQDYITQVQIFKMERIYHNLKNIMNATPGTGDSNVNWINTDSIWQSLGRIIDLIKYKSQEL